MQTSVQSASRSSPTTIPIPIPMARPMLVPTRRVLEFNYGSESAFNPDGTGTAFNVSIFYNYWYD